MKSVLMSIQPKWCELIANGKKTIEVRKTKPKLEVPFKVYIYCAKGKDVFAINGKFPFLMKKADVDRYNADTVRNGKVIGEFVCDRIMPYCRYEIISGVSEAGFEELTSATQLSRKELYEYCGEKDIYCWHISDLKIYDKPKELCEFFKYCGDNPKCDECEAFHYSNTECGKEEYCCSVVDGCKPLKRPPQSWCYIEKVE